jgi:hypothetical protein
LNAKSTPNAKSNFPEEDESASTLLPDSGPLGLPSEALPFPTFFSPAPPGRRGPFFFNTNFVAAPPAARLPTAPSTPVVIPPAPPGPPTSRVLRWGPRFEGWG